MKGKKRRSLSGSDSDDDSEASLLSSRSSSSTTSDYNDSSRRTEEETTTVNEGMSPALPVPETIIIAAAVAGDPSNATALRGSRKDKIQTVVAPSRVKRTKQPPTGNGTKRDPFVVRVEHKTKRTRGERLGAGLDLFRKSILTLCIA